MLTEINSEKAVEDLMNPQSVQGNRFLLTLFFINIEKKKGISICDIITTQRIPMMEINAIDRKAGCFAKIKTPIPAMVVIADNMIEDLKDERFFFPVLYSCNNPSMIKRL